MTFKETLDVSCDQLQHRDQRLSSCADRADLLYQALHHAARVDRLSGSHSSQKGLLFY